MTLIKRLLGRVRRELGTTRKLTPHILRHSAATNILREGGKLEAAAALLAHVDVNTTRRFYVHLGDAPQLDAVRRLEAVVPPDILATVANEAALSSSTEHEIGLDVQNLLEAARVAQRSRARTGVDACPLRYSQTMRSPGACCS